MKHVQVKPGLYLQQQLVEKPSSQGSQPKGKTNHIWLYDRSGSMYGKIKQLCSDLCDRAKLLPEGDTITLGWFSGEGQFNFILKGFKVTEEVDKTTIEKAINANSTIVGLTCFSEILTDTEQVVKDLSVISDSFALMLFTDGYPVVSNYSREIDRINLAVEAIKGKVTSSLLVGYGNYYNKELMSKMATQLGGSLCHSSTLKEFDAHLQEFVETASGNLPKKRVKLEAQPEGPVFSLNGRAIVSYELVEDNSVDFVPTTFKEDNIFYLTTEPIKGSREVQLTDATFNGNTKNDSVVRGLYAAAYSLTQNTRVDEALDILSLTGDKAVISSVVNAFTNEEYGRSEELMKRALMPSKRMSQGRDINFVPKKDAFCLIDLVDLLIEDPEATFFPYHERFKYNRIGKKGEVDPNYPKFEPEPLTEVKFQNLNWNNKKLNLSVLAEIPGRVELGDDAANLGLAPIFPTKIFRNYALIKDGFANVDELPIRASKKTIDRLRDEDVLVERSPGNRAIVDLKAIPVMNRAMADGKTSAKKLFEDRVLELSLMARIKVFKHHLSLLSKTDEAGPTSYGEKVEAFLETKGIKKGVFSPPKKDSESTDFYYVKEFELKVKGCSSLPSISAVETKIANKKKLNAADEMMKSALDYYAREGVSKMSQSVQTAWLKDELKNANVKLKSVRKDIQRTKFAIILGKKWFDEFDSRENCTMEVGGLTCSVSLREVKVAY